MAHFREGFPMLVTLQFGGVPCFHFSLIPSADLLNSPCAKLEVPFGPSIWSSFLGELCTPASQSRTDKLRFGIRARCSQLQAPGWAANPHDTPVPHACESKSQALDPETQPGLSCCRQIFCRRWKSWLSGAVCLCQGPQKTEQRKPWWVGFTNACITR